VQKIAMIILSLAKQELPKMHLSGNILKRNRNPVTDSQSKSKLFGGTG
jgi:hypothetical protein